MSPSLVGTLISTVVVVAALHLAVAKDPPQAPEFEEVAVSVEQNKTETFNAWWRTTQGTIA